MYVKIPLLQALHDVPIYAKTVRDLCVRKRGRKPKYPLTVHVVGNLSELMMGKAPWDKYDDPDNPIVTAHIGYTNILNVLVELGATINVMTIKTMKKLGLTNLRPNPTVLDLDDRSTIRPEGILYDLVFTIDSLEYPIYSLVL